jgi:hypothetical protein
MTLEQLLAAAHARLAYLTQLRITADRHGDIGEMARLDAEAAQTQSTINALEALLAG